MELKEKIQTRAPIFGILGIFSISAGIIISAINYSGRVGESYNFLNHFVSELGEYAYSDSAVAFNIGLVIGGLLLLVFMLGLAFSFGNWFGWLVGLLGLVTSISGALVGLFPMDNLGPHFSVAMTFFYSGLIITIIFSIYIIFLDKKRFFAPWLAIPGGVSAAAFFVFLFLTDPIVPEDSPVESLTLALENRPPVWETAVFEWVVVFSIFAWILCLSIFQLKSQQNNQ